MKPTTVRDLLLGLGLTAGLGGFVEACSSQDSPPSHLNNGNEGGTTGGRGAGGIMGNGPGGFTGGTGGFDNGLGGFTGAGGFTNFGAGGNAIRGGAPGQLDASDDTTSDAGNADAGGPIDVGPADTSEDGG